MGDVLTPETVSVIIGVLVTLATSLAKNPSWSLEKKTLLLGGVSVLGAVLQNVAAGTLDLSNVAESLTVIVTSSIFFYNLYFRKTKANEKLENTGYQVGK